MLLSYFSFIPLSMRIECFAQNIDVGKVKRLFQPPCMEPISGAPGRLSLPCTISHPEAAPAAAWPGFVLVQHRAASSAMSTHLFPQCLVLHRELWGHPGAPNNFLQPETCSQSSSAKGNFPCCTGQGRQGVVVCPDVEWLMWAPQTQPSFPKTAVM